MGKNLVHVARWRIVAVTPIQPSRFTSNALMG
jgi:hypothetical protein